MTSDRQISNTRLVDAPPERVWEVWTSAAHLAKWWGPNGFTNEIAEMDVRVGGVFRFVMVGPDGKRWPNLITYTAVERPTRLAWVHGASEDDPDRFESEVTFEAVGARTRITLTATFATAERREFLEKAVNAREGGQQTLARMEAAVASEPEFTLTRRVRAPRAKVWAAWTERAALAQWWGPAGMKLEIHTFDLRPGGMFHYSMVPPGGGVWWGRFVYREVTPMERLAYVSGFSTEDGGPARPPFAATFPQDVFNLVTFTDAEDGGTVITLKGGPINATAEEKAFYEGMYASMNQGFSGTFAQLEAYLGE